MLKAEHLSQATNGELVRYHRAAYRIVSKKKGPSNAPGSPEYDRAHALMLAIEAEAEERIREAQKPVAAAARAYKAAGGRPGRLVRGPEREELLKANAQQSKIEKALRHARRAWRGAREYPGER